MLPDQPRDEDDPGFWTNEKEILCPSEESMEILFEFLDDILREFGSYYLITGWHEPEEDCDDKVAGFNYIKLEV